MPAPNIDTNNSSLRSPTVSSGSRNADPSPQPPASHRGSVSSTRSRASPSASLKRLLSPGSDELDSKRPQTDALKRRVPSPSDGRCLPISLTGPSPVPFRTQRASRSPEARQTIDPYPPSPPLPAVLPPHPRPIYCGQSAWYHSGMVQTIGDRYGGLSVANIALRWVLNHSFVGAVLID